jgi:hypothetical protein
VVLAFDPMGQGERIQAYDRRLNRALVPGGVQEHWLAGTQALLVGDTLARYFIWDAKRALDYLVAHPAVDAARIGATGCSAGTQTTYISALDPRIRVAAPLCYMNSFEVLFPGSIGDSEQSLPNFLSEGLDQTDYVLHFAPKPWLIGSTEEDFFTQAGAKVIYEAARSFYRIFDAESSVKWVVGPGGHGTPKEVRTALHGWFQQWLLGRGGIDGGGSEHPDVHKRGADGAADGTGGRRLEEPGPGGTAAGAAEGERAAGRSAGRGAAAGASAGGGAGGEGDRGDVYV